MPDEKLAAAILAAVNAFLDEEAQGAKPARQNWWSYSGRLSATAQRLAWLRRPR